MAHGVTSEQYSVTVRRYACMALTNLTFGDGKNKALLCSMHPAMVALVAQLRSPNEDLCQGAASVLRNLSWRADLASKKTLREVGAVTTLMEAAMNVKKETTLKSILSALWNLSSHCSENKAEICLVKGALEFLVGLLTFKSPGKTHAIVENGGGILRNVSSQIAMREDYRRILRQKGCLQILLSQLRSTSLTIVSNACGTLWNLSARCPEDQQLLRDMGAVSMLRNLVHSKHRMIAMGSSAALRNLLSSAGPGKGLDCDRGGSVNRPILSARKQRALEEELDQNLAEVCDNVESPRDSPTDKSDEGRRFVYPFDVSQNKSDEDPRRALHRRQVMTRCGSSAGTESQIRSPQRVPRAGSQDSVSSTHSDISHDRSRVQNMLAKSSHLLHRRQCSSLERKEEPGIHRVSSDNSCISAPDRHHSSGVESVSRSTGPSNRIVQYMQEVAKLAGVDSGTGLEQPQERQLSDKSQSLLSSKSQNNIGKSNNVYMFPSNSFSSSNTSHRALYEHLVKSNSDGGGGVSLNQLYAKEDRGGESDGSEVPINYSLRYKDVNPHIYPDPSARNVNYSKTASGSSHGHSDSSSVSGNYVRTPNSQMMRFHSNTSGPPSVRVNNYMMPPPSGNGVYPGNGPNLRPRQIQHGVQNRFPAPNSLQQRHQLQQHQRTQQPYHPRHRNIGSHQPASSQYSAYAETDLDSFDDQPTDFSLRYTEEHSDGQEQPMNYSVRYRNDPDPHCVECKYEEALRTNERLDQSVNDDQVLTFCTEGTPYLSTATSLMDLTVKPEREADEEDDGKEEEEEDGGDELHNYSVQYGEAEHGQDHIQEGHAVSNPVQYAAKQPQDNSRQQLSGQSIHANDDSIPSDQVKTYCEEGTPVCFSRVSSLSSLHSSESRDNQENGRHLEVLQSISETEKGNLMSSSVIENKNAVVKTALVDRDTRYVSVLCVLAK